MSVFFVHILQLQAFIKLVLVKEYDLFLCETWPSTRSFPCCLCRTSRMNCKENLGLIRLILFKKK